MPIELAGITLNRIHRITTLERADLPGHRIPGLAGTVFQDTGRHSARLLVEGIYYGDNAAENLQKLRDLYKKRAEAEFLAEIVGQAYFSQVVIEQMEVEQSAAYPQQFGFRLMLAEYVPPPAIGIGADVLADVDGLLGLDAANFMDMVQLPDLLQLPEIADPTIPLSTIEAGFLPAKTRADGLMDSTGPVYDSVKTGLNEVTLPTSTSTPKDTPNFGEISTLAYRLLTNTNITTNGREEKLATGLDTLAEVRPDKAADIGLQAKAKAVQIAERLNDDWIAPINDLAGKLSSLADVFPVPAPVAVPQRRDSVTGRNITGTTTAELLAFLNLPDAFNFIGVVQWIDDQLKKIPGENIPLYYDELAEKIEAILRWYKMDKEDVIVEQIVTSFNSFKGQIGRVRSASVEDIKTDTTECLKTILSMDNFDDRVNQITEDLNNFENLPDKEASIKKIKKFIDDVIRIGSEEIKSKGISLHRRLSTFEDDLEDRLSALILLSLPSNQLSALTISPEDLRSFSALNEVKVWKETVGQWSTKIENAIAQLQSRLSVGIIGNFADDIKDLADKLVSLAVGLNLQLGRINGLIAQSEILNFDKEFGALLDYLENTLGEKVNIALGPVMDAYATLNNIVDEVEKEVHNITEGLKTVTEQIHGKLKDGLGEVSKLKNKVEDLNHSIGEVDYKSATDTVLTAIDTINQALEFAGFIPVPDSVANETRKLVALLPKPDEVNGTVNSLKNSDALDGIKNSLNVFNENIKNAVDPLAEKIDQLFATAEEGLNVLSQKYEGLTNQLDEFNPQRLAEAIRQLKDKIMAELKPGLEQLFAQFKNVLERIRETLQQLRPEAVLATIENSYESIFTRLDEQFKFSNIIEPAENIFNNLKAGSEKFSGLLTNLTSRIQSEEDIKMELGAIKQGFKAKINGLKPVQRKLIEDTYKNIKGELDNLKSSAIKGELGLHTGGTLDTLIQQIKIEDAPGKLAKLAEAWVRLKNKPSGFNPLDDEFIHAFNWLGQNYTSLQEHQRRIGNFLEDAWDQRYFGSGATIYKILLGDDWENKNISTTLTDQFDKQIDALYGLVFPLITELKNIFEGLKESLKPATMAIKELIESIERFADELSTLNPANRISEEVDIAKGNLAKMSQTVDAVFASLEIDYGSLEERMNKLLSAALLDKISDDLGSKHIKIVEGLLALNPVKKLEEIGVTAIKDDITGIVREMDVSFLTDILIKRLTVLKEGLSAELERVGTSYEKMYKTLDAKFG